MISDFSELIRCELCQGVLEASQEDTIKDYAMIMNVDSVNIFDTVDALLNKHIVYVCVSCGNKVKYTYKDIEYIFRRTLTEKFLLLAVKDLIGDIQVLKDKYFIYCGKCQGFDGQGSCPKTMFEKCEIKRFPVNGL